MTSSRTATFPLADGRTAKVRVRRAPAAETTQRFACFGGTVTIMASGRQAPKAVAEAKLTALEVHRRLSRFDPGSELSLLNSNPAERVRASAMLRSLVAATRKAGAISGGLVDATCLPAIQAAGYDRRWDAHNPDRGPRAVSNPWWTGSWADIDIDGDHVVRPPGLTLDSGGLGKGLATDLMASAMADCETWLIDCGGDLRLGGAAGTIRAVKIADPYDPAGALHEFRIARGAVATSGTTARAWANGHHLIDPRTKRPADTGVVQATAFADTCLLAEIRAKTALLRGVPGAPDVLRDGGALVTHDGHLFELPLRS